MKTSIKPKNELLPLLLGRVRLAEFLSLQEDEFVNLVSNVEQGALFKKLKNEERIIKYRSFPGTDLSGRICSFREEISHDHTSPDIISLLENKKRVVRLIRKIGLEKYKQYFLYNEKELSLEQIAAKCNLKVNSVREMIDLTNQVSLWGEFHSPGPDNSVSLSYRKIAAIEQKDGELNISYYLPSYARGRYVIAYTRLYGLMKQGLYLKSQRRQLKQLLSLLELINTRKTIVYQILEKIIEFQKGFLLSGDEEQLVTFSQRAFARTLGVSPSSVSRAINSKSIEITTNEEIPLKGFFNNGKERRKKLVQEILDEFPKSSDSGIQKYLKERYKVLLARRTICAYRHEVDGKNQI